MLLGYQKRSGRCQSRLPRRSRWQRATGSAACLYGCMSRARCMGLTTRKNIQASHASTQSFAQPGVFCIPLKTQA